MIICLMLIFQGLPLIATDKAFAASWVNGYQKKNGTWVKGHWRDTSNDGYQWNNVNQK